MSTVLTAQRAFNGESFNDGEVLRKDERGATCSPDRSLTKRCGRCRPLA